MKSSSITLLKAGCIILLIACLFNLKYESYEIIRFILTVTFCWLAIKEKQPTKQGWRFLFASLVFLFNPFFKLQLGAHLWKVADSIVALLLVFNLFEETNVKPLYSKIRALYIEKKEYLRYMGYAILVTAALAIVMKGYQLNKQIKEEKRAKEVSDSLKIIQDEQNKLQANEARRKKYLDFQIKKKNLQLYRTEDNAVEAFNKFMKFYHPDWMIMGKINVKEYDAETIQISTLIRRKEADWDDPEPIIVRVHWWEEDFYEKYTVWVDTKPIMFKE